MSIYLNVNTKEYPRHDGDLELLGWQIGQPLPEGWVEVVGDFPTLEAGEDCSEIEPKEINGVWTRQWSIVQITEEELKERVALFKAQQNSGA
jgi:hypothetical protein